MTKVTYLVNYHWSGFVSEISVLNPRVSDNFTSVLIKGSAHQRHARKHRPHLSDPTSFVVAINDILNCGSGSRGVSLDPKCLDVIGDGVPRDGDSIDGHPGGDGTLVETLIHGLRKQLSKRLRWRYRVHQCRNYWRK